MCMLIDFDVPDPEASSGVIIGRKKYMLQNFNNKAPQQSTLFPGIVLAYLFRIRSIPIDPATGEIHAPRLKSSRAVIKQRDG